MVVAYGLGLATVFAFLAFLGHITRQLRVETMMRSVHEQTSAAIQSFYVMVETLSRAPVTPIVEAA